MSFTSPQHDRSLLQFSNVPSEVKLGVSALLGAAGFAIVLVVVLYIRSRLRRPAEPIASDKMNANPRSHPHTATPRSARNWGLWNYWATPRNYWATPRQSVDVEATQPPDIDSASPPKPDARRELLARQASIAGVFNTYLISASIRAAAFCVTDMRLAGCTAFEELDMPESGKSKPSQHSERSTPQDARERVISPFRQEADARERLISPDRQEADARSSDLVIEQYNDIVNVQLQRKLRVGLDSMFAAQMELQNERLAIAQGLQQMWALLEEEGAQQVVLTDWGLLEPILDAMLSTSYAFASSIKLPSLQYESLAQGSEQVAVLVMSTHAEPTTEASTLRRWSLDVSPPKPEPKTSSNFIDLKSTELHLAQRCARLLQAKYDAELQFETLCFRLQLPAAQDLSSDLLTGRNLLNGVNVSEAGLRSGSLPQTQELPTTDAVQEFSRVVESKDTCDIEEESFHDAGDVETEQTKSSLREMREMGKMWEREDCDASLDAVKLAITTNIATIFSPRGSALPEPDEFHDSLPSMSPGGPAQCRVEEPAGDPQPAAVLPDPSAAVSVAIVADGREAFRDGGSERVEKAGSPPGYPPGISEATAILEPRAVAAQRQQGGAHTPGTRDAEATSSRCLSPAPAERACGGPSPELAATPSLPHLIAEASPVADAGSAGKAGPGTSAVTSSGDKCKPEPAHDHGLPASQSHVLDRDIS
eukprot:gene11562-13662_t